MPTNQFCCANPKCAYAIDSDGLNKIQLKALRMWAKTCPKCGQMTHWIEQTSLLETPKQSMTNGGSQNANTNTSIPKSQSQKRRSARHDGSH